jgi:hypothetical protein
MSLNHTKTYESLTTLNAGAAYTTPKVKIVQCSALLQNRMQCWRAADILITTTESTPTENDPFAVTTTTVQMCIRHAHVDQQAYNQAVQDDTNATQLQAEADAAAAKIEAEKEKAPVTAATE